jgi:hypothetical protein
VGSDLPDHRDRLFVAPPRRLSLCPRTSISAAGVHRWTTRPVGSCTANAIGGALQFNQMKEGQSDIFVPSRLFIYYNERHGEQRRRGCRRDDP